MRLRAVAPCLLLLAAAPPAHADTQPAAADVQAQLRAALGPLGGDQAPPEKQIRVTQEGDHLKIAVPFYALYGMSASSPSGDTATTATARLVDGRWDVEDIDSPSPVTVTVKSPDGKADVRTTTSRGDQNGRALFDPTLATDSSMTMIVRKIASESTIGDLHQAQRIESVTAQAGLVPHGDGRLDFSETLDATSVAIAMQLPDGKAVEIALDRGSFDGKLDQVRKDRIGPLSTLLLRAFGSLMGGGSAPGKLPTLDPAVGQDLAAALDDLAVGGKLDEQADNIRVVAGGKRGSADHAAFGFGASAPAGDLTAYVDVLVDGLALPDVPDAAGLTPRHIALRPSISGIDMHTLTQLIRSAAAPGADTGMLGMQALGLLASGRLRIGIDTFAFDLGDARFGGTGAVNVRSPSPAGIEGSARVTAENFDSFVKQMQAAKQPDVAKIIPALIYAKGLAQNDGGKLVWNVAYAGGKLTVNGIDPTPAPGGAAPGGAAPGGRAAPGAPSAQPPHIKP
jgi:hypothetical protein